MRERSASSEFRNDGILVTVYQQENCSRMSTDTTVSSSVPAIRNTGWDSPVRTENLDISPWIPFWRSETRTSAGHPDEGLSLHSPGQELSRNTGNAFGSARIPAQGVNLVSEQSRTPIRCRRADWSGSRSDELSRRFCVATRVRSADNRPESFRRGRTVRRRGQTRPTITRRWYATSGGAAATHSRAPRYAEARDCPTSGDPRRPSDAGRRSGPAP